MYSISLVNLGFRVFQELSELALIQTTMIMPWLIVRIINFINYKYHQEEENDGAKLQQIPNSLLI